MEFEWNPVKDTENKRKHGISFNEAVAIWNGGHLEIDEVAHPENGESRSATMGWIGHKIYVAIWVERNERIRLISVRRARLNEEKIFREKIQD